MVDISELPRFDISNEAWREYLYRDGAKLRVENPVTLILERREAAAGGHVHRLIVRHDGGEAGMYITPGWYAIRWQTPSGEHGIRF